MKFVFIGGGSHRYLSVARSILSMECMQKRSEICLYDLDVERASFVGNMIFKTPEFKQADCHITWGKTLDESLEGADAVYVVLMAGSLRNSIESHGVAARHGFIGSDQLSPSGAMLALKGGQILMNIARMMERICPDAWLVNFANPVAVHSAAVNNHTKIKCLGVCEGYINHQWDLTRLIYDVDEQWTDYQIINAGVNHLSFILSGSTHRNRDIHELVEEKCKIKNWHPCSMSDRWAESEKQSMKKAVATLREYYQQYRQLVFSSEEDGVFHLDIAGRYEAYAESQRSIAEQSIDSRVSEIYSQRKDANQSFSRWIDLQMTDEDWNTPKHGCLYLLRDDENVMAKVAKAITSYDGVLIATSFPNQGAIEGIPDRTVLEYSQQLSINGIKAVDGLYIPGIFMGLIAGLANHQTLLGDAIATEDPRILFEALYSYPVKQDTQEFREMWPALLEASREEVPEVFQKAKQYFTIRSTGIEFTRSVYTW